MAKQSPNVDDADVERVIDLLMKNVDPALSPETRADLALGFAKLTYTQTSPEWAEELAR
jgi:hypothetical protein